MPDQAVELELDDSFLCWRDFASSACLGPGVEVRQNVPTHRSGAGVYNRIGDDDHFFVMHEQFVAERESRGMHPFVRPTVPMVDGDGVLHDKGDLEPSSVEKMYSRHCLSEFFAVVKVMHCRSRFTADGMAQ